MKNFFNDNILLDGKTAKTLYKDIKDLPIIDYHCHLDQKLIAGDSSFDNLGQLWLANDHYKWRAMRMCGIDEYYITGGADWKEKFIKFASIMPMLIGNPIYYWSHMELRQIFGINCAINEASAEDIYQKANKKLKEISVLKLLKNYNVEFIATTDNPCDQLDFHKTYDGKSVSPTFRPDNILAFDQKAISELAKSAGMSVQSYADLKAALCKRIDFFVSKGCRISDHSFPDFPKNYIDDDEAEHVYKNLAAASGEERDGLFGNLLLQLMREYKKRDIVVQLHFSVERNVNTPMFAELGPDAGFDVISAECELRGVSKFLDKLPDGERPAIILHTLNPNAIAPLASISGAFRNVYIGAAWWFNDTLEGIKRNLSIIAEYACLGTSLGMLTDSRSFVSYSRFDFFRRILCAFIGRKVDKGEYSLLDALTLAKNICYYNVKRLLKI